MDSVKVRRTGGVAALLLLLMGLLLLVVVPMAGAGDGSTVAAVKRPISEFVAAQGTYCFDDGAGGCVLFEPPVQNFLGANDPARDRAGAVDYAGLANKYIVENGGVSLGTRMTGTITEKARPDGRATVSVVLVTKRALTWVEDGADYSGPLLFGYKAPEVLAGKKPGLCNSLFKVTFINTAPGAPMPDLIQLVIFPEPGQELKAISLQCNAKGPLRADFGVPENTPGHAIIKQNGKLIDGVLTFTKEDVILK